jgi:NodT family efflux transporter outer membrane factor (OMF) lipoprotein
LPQSINHRACCGPLLVAALLGGCAAAPAYVAPKTSLPAAYRNAGPAAAEDARSWWSRFDDPVLEELVSRMAGANLDLQEARARVRQARAQVEIARARTAPQLTADAQASTTRLSKNGSLAQIAQSLPTGGAAGLPGSTITTFQAGLDASWEADLFGAGAQGVSAARARQAGAQWSARDVELGLTAEVAGAYLRYRAAQARLALADQRAAEQGEALETAAVRARNGLSTTLDPRRAEQRLAATRAVHEALIADREGQLQALAVLVGASAGDLERTLARPADAAIPDVPAGLPSELLRRRADVRAAERKLAAAGADLGAARADLYPKLTLTGGLDLVSTSLKSLFDAGSLQPTAAAKLAFPLLDGGRRRGTVDLRDAQRDEAYAAYQQTVLVALRDVEIALSRLAADRARLADLAAAEAAAHDAYDTAAVQYRNGLTAGPDLLTLQDEWLAARDARVQSQIQAQLDVVALGKALGGGWPEEKTSPQ